MGTHLPKLIVAATLALGAPSFAHAREAVVPEAPSASALPGDSLYQLPVTLETSDGERIRFGEFAGRPLLVTMFYAQCASICPLLTARLDALVEGLKPAERQRLRVLMVSFDSARDAPALLNAFKAQHRITAPNWVLARASARDVRTLSAALGIKYRELPDHTFNHSTKIVLLDEAGVLKAQTERVEAPPPEFFRAIQELTESP